MVKSLWIYDAKLAKILRGCIVALDVEKRTARIKTYREGVVSFSIHNYTVFNSDGLGDLADSLRTHGYNDHDRFVHRVKVGLDKDNEMMWAKRIPHDDPVYGLELIKSMIKRRLTKEEYRVKEEYLDWLISFFNEYWPDFALDSATDYCTSVFNPQLYLGENNTIDCYWGDGDTVWAFEAIIDLTNHTIKGTRINTIDSFTGYNFSLNLDNEEDRKKLFEMLDVLKEKKEEDGQ